MNNSITKALLFVIALSTSIMTPSLNAIIRILKAGKKVILKIIHLNAFQQAQLQNIQDVLQKIFLKALGVKRIK